MKTVNIDLFVKSYLQTASWVECDSDENQDFTMQGIAITKADCIKFINAVTEKLGLELCTELLTIVGNDSTYLAPHCFYLNRNGHGSGFWDRDEFGEHQNILSEIAIVQKHCTAYHTRGKKSKLSFD